MPTRTGERRIESSTRASIIRALVVGLIGSSMLAGGAYAAMSVLSGPNGWAAKAAAAAMPSAVQLAADEAR